MRNVVKARIYPTTEQQTALSKAFGCARWWWNYALNLNNETYKATGKGLSRQGYNDCLPELKKEFPWLTECYSQVLQSVSLNLSQAFINFFERRTKYPNFKSKHNKQSIQYPQHVKLLDGAIKLPKIGEVKAKLHRVFDGKLKTVTVSMSKTGKYYASLLFDDGLPEPEISSQGKTIGVDVGLTHFAITSDGSKFDNPKPLKKYEKNLKRKQRKLSRKQKGSKRRAKARRIVARVHQQIANTRKDFQHKLSRKLVNENQVIIVENLAVKNMVKNHNLAKAISDCGWSEFTRQLKYKAEKDGKTYLEIGRFFPSSKTCHVCLNQVGSLPQNVRSWECPNCKTRHDRDINAAINIRDEGLRLLALGTSATAQGGNVRPKRGRKSSVEAVAVELGSPVPQVERGSSLESEDLRHKAS
ncbi:RNA-guided endonuclease TnpB family protein [Limnoraphis robusta Tam1]|uniref:RNA-guided endonuclease TnpB family protein n=2 Tax=Limnoraphis TaxID=1332112 RepID=A0ABU5TRZ9_9CYAN|nr:RNA-guided endonuclease TnpB family protein [Limnoraphis robusta]MEA5517688.1 RNA-guided endonuclease TnpB family protein [Limnoraphis robusta CCNP1315]MEA5538196.1 RNA-guided endonuclease TnpB family protein [Limnoraphis robusta Tam1]